MHPLAAVPLAGPFTQLSVCVVGAGLAGAQTCAALRQHGLTGRITVIGSEGVPPYDRPPLSKELFSRPEPAWLDQEMGLDLAPLADDVRLDDPAVALDLGGTRPAVRMARGQDVEADVVVLACGSVPVRPTGWSGISTLHTAADAEALRDRLAPGSQLVVIGAGWIGAEVAGVAVAHGVHVTVVEAAAAPLARQLGESVGALLAQWYDDAGVTLITDTTVTDASAHGVTLRHCGPSGTTTSDTSQWLDARLPADVVLTAVGARPATDWLQTSGLPLDERGAILVDEGGAVRRPGVDAPTVFAVGDCATRADTRWQEVPGGHWSAALLDPDTVARRILSLPTPTVPAPYVFSTQLGHDLAFFGRPDPASDRVVLRGAPDTGAGWSVFYVREVASTEVVTGILVIDSPRDVAAARRLMAAGPAWLDLSRVADPAVPLKASAMPNQHRLSP